MKDMTCLGEAACYELDGAAVNRNEVIVGGTGTGKTFSTVYSRLSHTYESSVVIPVVKQETIDLFAPAFRKRGYRTEILDFPEPEKGTIGFDPLDHVKKEKDVADLAHAIVFQKADRRSGGSYDPYWDYASQSLSTAINLLEMLNANYQKRKPSFRNVLKMHEVFQMNERECEGNTMDLFFDKAIALYPESSLRRVTRSFRRLPHKTAYTVMSTLNVKMDKLFSEEAIRLMDMKQFDVTTLGREKTALFIRLPLLDMNMLSYVNIFYHLMFKELFEEAERSPGHTLPVKVHCVLDDFAVAGQIVDFPEWISIFRAAGISVTILLQSETQLAAAYGTDDATTVLNNCDTYVYTGGVDLVTCENMSKRLNKVLDHVLTMPLEQFAVFRRGERPVFTRRYQTLDDPVFQEILKMQNQGTLPERGE